MSAKLVVGTQWGDEGKAKFIDYFSSSIDIIVRYQGGANAGHTVKVKGEEYIFHLVPSGILYPNTTCILANGVVLDLESFLQELSYLETRKIPNFQQRILISDTCHLVLPVHLMMDKEIEQKAGSKKIGTTGRGIGVCYEDKARRIGIRVGELFDEKILSHAVERFVEQKNPILKNVYGLPEIHQDKLKEKLLSWGKIIKTMTVNTSIYLDKALKNNKRILLEGAQGTALDIDFGTYPYVTSSSPTTGGALSGSGISLHYLKEVIGICKAYVTRVGEGPFPTEANEEEGKQLREYGNEIGATTGRPRRCGWFDVELLRHSARINGLTGLALTKIDILSKYEKIRVGVGYIYKGERLDHFPSQGQEEIQVEYEYLQGWKKDIGGARKLSELPAECRSYIAFIEEKVQVPIQFISVGAEREQTIVI